MALVLFNVFVILALIADLGLFNKSGQAVSIKKSFVWTGIWVLISCLFGAGVWYVKGADLGAEFFTAYVMEKSLSVDNLFVIMMVFSYFKIDKDYQHKALFYGILGAIILRGIFVIGGVELVSQFDWMLYFFGALLIYLGIKTIVSDDDEEDINDGIAIKIANKILPWKVETRSIVLPRFKGKFFTHYPDKRATPLLLAVIVIELSDIIFAVDSIPVVISVTQDQFIAYTSNILAVLGLRSLYFAFQEIMNKLEYVKYGIGTVLAFIGIKMLLDKFGVYHMETVTSLIIVCTILLTSTIWSLMKAKVDG
jgi:tellurite resistance protein TerC